MIKIGITGGIGSGKTVVASLLQLMGVPVYIADDESKRLTDVSPLIHRQLTALLGEDIYIAEGLNRPLLASHIFSDPDKLAKVNAIIHPEVNRHFLEWAGRQTGSICAIETAILFESGFDRIVDHSLMIYAPLELRIERTMQRGGFATREEVLRRISKQLPDEQKKEQADYVILNDNIHALIPQTISVLSAILR